MQKKDLELAKIFPIGDSAFEFCDNLYVCPHYLVATNGHTAVWSRFDGPLRSSGNDIHISKQSAIRAVELIEFIEDDPYSFAITTDGSSLSLRVESGDIGTITIPKAPVPIGKETLMQGLFDKYVTPTKDAKATVIMSADELDLALQALKQIRSATNPKGYVRLEFNGNDKALIIRDLDEHGYDPENQNVAAVMPVLPDSIRLGS